MVNQRFLLVLAMLLGLSPVDEAILTSSGWGNVLLAPFGTPVQEEEEEAKYTVSPRSSKRASDSNSWEAGGVSARPGLREKLAGPNISTGVHPQSIRSSHHNGFGGFLRC